MSNEKNIGTPRPSDHHIAHLSVFIGRFQPAHFGHYYVIRQALKNTDCLVVLVGSAGQPRDYFNPFTFEERKQMIEQCIPAEDRGRVCIQPLYDWTYDENRWLVDVQTAVRTAQQHFGLDWTSRVTLIGHSKDRSSYYLKRFPQWSSFEVANYHDLSSTPLRKAYFADNWTPDLAETVPAAVAEFLTSFRTTADHRELVEEFTFIAKYRKQYEGLPHPPTFNTTDACVIQSGHVLMVERKARPGKGLWALPGGFVEHDEWIDESVLRELKEETGIKVAEPVLRGSFVTQRKFDAPYRSARGRTITFASLFHLTPQVELPKVKGDNKETKKAFWVPIAELPREKCFEDHFHIIHALADELKNKPKAA